MLPPRQRLRSRGEYDVAVVQPLRLANRGRSSLGYLSSKLESRGSGPCMTKGNGVLRTVPGTAR